MGGRRSQRYHPISPGTVGGGRVDAHQHSTDIDGVARFHCDVRDHSRSRRHHLVFHFHRFNDTDHVSGFHFNALFCGYPYHGAVHRAGDGGAALGKMRLTTATAPRAGSLILRIGNVHGEGPAVDEYLKATGAIRHGDWWLLRSARDVAPQGASGRCGPTRKGQAGSQMW